MDGGCSAPLAAAIVLPPGKRKCYSLSLSPAAAVATPRHSSSAAPAITRLAMAAAPISFSGFQSVRIVFQTLLSDGVWGGWGDVGRGGRGGGNGGLVAGAWWNRVRPNPSSGPANAQKHRRSSTFESCSLHLDGARSAKGASWAGWRSMAAAAKLQQPSSPRSPAPRATHAFELTRRHRSTKKIKALSYFAIPIEVQSGRRFGLTKGRDPIVPPLARARKNEAAERSTRFERAHSPQGRKRRALCLAPNPHITPTSP